MKLAIMLGLFLVSLSSFASVQMVEGGGYYRTLSRLLERSDIKQIDIIQFRFSKITNRKLKTNNIYKKLLQLKSKAQVRFFLDNHGNGNQETVEQLKRDGFEVKTTTGQQISHTKSVAINGKVLLFGSTNWTHTSLSFNNEINVLVENDPIVDDYQTYFETLWNAGAENRQFSFNHHAKGRLLTDREFFPHAIELIKSAQQSLDIATYFFAYREEFKDASDKIVGELIEEIANVILKKNVRVRFFLDYNGIPDKHAHTRAAENAIQYLRKLIAKSANANDLVEVYYDSFEQISHGKFIIADKTNMITGSSNLYWKDLNENLQLNLLTDDVNLVREFVDYFENKIKNAGHYYRFWRGIKRDQWNSDVVSFYQSSSLQNPCLEQALLRDENQSANQNQVSFNSNDFECLLNLWLIPATPSYSAQTSLQAYLPVITNLDHTDYIHDEIAMIVYNNEREYLRLRSIGGKEGETYGPLHMDVFGSKDSKRKSGSLVPTIYAGKINLSQTTEEQSVSYNLKNNATDWQKGITYFRILLKDNLSTQVYLSSLENYLNQIQTIRTILGHMVLITDLYMIEYVNVRDQSELDSFKKESQGLVSRLTFEEEHIAQKLTRESRHPLLYTPLRYTGTEGMAANVLFEKGTKPGQVEHYRLRR